jgi:hypothetical protein
LIRKHAWISNRKRSEEGAKDQLDALAPYLVPPFDGWRTAATALKGDVPDFLFLERGGPPSELVNVRDLISLPPLPMRWEFQKNVPERRSGPREIPRSLLGRELFLALRYRSDKTEPVRVWLEFDSPTRPIPFLTLKPYLFTDMSPDFFAFRVPSDAKTFSMRLRVSPGTKWLELETFDLFASPPKEPAPLKRGEEPANPPPTPQEFR